jgi:hypothetical protein
MTCLVAAGWWSRDSSKRIGAVVVGSIILGYAGLIAVLIRVS